MDDPRQYQAAANLLEDRVILVTGAGAGIGRAAALAFADHGARVVLLGRTQSSLENVYDEIESRGGARPWIAVLDLLAAQGPDYDALTDRLHREFGHLDGLLHNAGLLGHRSPIEHYDQKVWFQVMQVNLNAPFLLTQSLWPLLRESDDASVVFTSSGVGRRGRAYWGAYAVSKFGTEGLAQVLAEETGASGIRFNCVNPGATRTAMRKSAYPAEDPQSLAAPEDVLAPYLFLMGPDSRGVNGQSFDSQ